MTTMLKPWMDQFSTILGQSVQPEDPDDWSMRMEVSMVFCSNFMSSWLLIGISAPMGFIALFIRF